MCHRSMLEKQEVKKRNEARTKERARKTWLWSRELHPKLKNQILTPVNILDESLLWHSLISNVVVFFSL